jgi:hypothetical protein
MAYPTDDTEPRVGVAAFAENDPASQLAQAAYLLLLGRELRRHRGQHKPPPHPVTTQAASRHMPQPLDVVSMQSVPAFTPVQSPVAPQ